MKLKKIYTITRNIYGFMHNGPLKSRLVSEIQCRDSRRLKAVWLRQVRI